MCVFEKNRNAVVYTHEKAGIPKISKDSFVFTAPGLQTNTNQRKVTMPLEHERNTAIITGTILDAMLKLNGNL